MNEEQAKILEETINTAIYHGGDYGGAYFIKKEELGEKLDRLVEALPNLKWEWHMGDGYEVRLMLK